MASEMGQTWKMWGQDPFLSGFWMPPEPEVPSFQRLGVTGKILWCLLDPFTPEDSFEGTMSKDMPCHCPCSSFPSGPGGEEPPCSWKLATHQFFLRLLGQGIFLGL